MSFQNYCALEEIEKLLNATYNNNQIGLIINDDDIKEFIGRLYISSKGVITNKETINFLEEIFK